MAMAMTKERASAASNGEMCYVGKPCCTCQSEKRFVADGKCVGCRRAKSNKYHTENRKLIRIKEVESGARLANRVTYTEVKGGRLPKLSSVEVACVDCGRRATQYDHRDYNKPLDVDPVCRSCNQIRGPAIPLTEENRNNQAFYRV